MYTWHILLHYPHGANAGCDLAGVAPVVLLIEKKQFATRRVLQRFAVGWGWPQSLSYYNTSDAHHVKFTYKNDSENPWNLSQKSLTGRGVRHIGRTVQSLYFLSWTTVLIGSTTIWLPEALAGASENCHIAAIQLHISRLVWKGRMKVYRSIFRMVISSNGQ